MRFGKLISSFEDVPKMEHMQLYIFDQDYTTTLYCPDPGESGIATTLVETCKCYCFLDMEELKCAIRHCIANKIQYKVIKCVPMETKIEINVGI